jgi:TRAP-type C4-dicarboxylate transport system permease small subunit
MRLLKSAAAAAANVLMVVAGLSLVAMLVLACANMVLRLFGYPILGTYELMGFLGALVTGFALAATQLKGGHIALTVLAGALPKALERAVDAASSLACAAFFFLVAWRTAAWAGTLTRMGELSETLRIPFQPFVYALALGCAVLGLALLADAAAAMARLKEEQR